MSKIAYITDLQANQLVGLEWVPDNFFNPVQYTSNQWFISEEEVLGNININVPWVNTLPLTDYIPNQQLP
jgi:hypothetical protein